MKNIDLFLKRLAALVIDLAAVYIPAHIAGFKHGELIVVWILYETILLAYWNGTTIGKLRVGLKVVAVDNKNLSLTKALIRAVVKIFSTIILFLGDFWMLWDKKNQTWHDKMADAIVISNVE